MTSLRIVKSCLLTLLLCYSSCVLALSSDLASERSCKALVIYKESNLEPLQGQRMVLTVLENRISAHHSSCIKEISKAGQWSFYSKDGTFKADKKQLTRYSIVRRMAPLFPEATHFHATHVKPKWARKMRYLGKVGHHYFYTTRR